MRKFGCSERDKRAALNGIRMWSILDMDAGVCYASIAEASREAGVSRWAVEMGDRWRKVRSVYRVRKEDGAECVCRASRSGKVMFPVEDYAKGFEMGWRYEWEEITAAWYLQGSGSSWE